MFSKAVSFTRSENAARWMDFAFAVGFLFSIYLQALYFGQIAGVPSMVLSYGSLLPLFFAAIISKKDFKNAVVYLPILLTVAVLISAFVAASADQWGFLFDPGRWGLREQEYRLAKLTKVILFFIPTIIALTCLVLPSERNKVIDGFFAGLVFFGALAAARVLLVNWNVIVATPFEEAYRFYANPRGFSLVSYAYLISTAALASLRFKRGWILSGVFVFVLVLLSRRYETLATLIFIAGFLMWFLAGRNRNKAWPYALALVLATLLIVPLHNGHNAQYFASLGSGIQYRIDMVRATFINEEPAAEHPIAEAGGEGEAQLDTGPNADLNDGPANVDGAELPVEEKPALGVDRSLVPSPEAVPALPVEPATPSLDGRVSDNADGDETARGEHEEVTPEVRPAPLQDDVADNDDQKEIKGLGSYQQRFNSRFRYPHNVVVEAYVETGILSVVFIAALVFVPIGVALSKAVKGTFDKTAALTIALLLLVFGATLKAGDIIGVTRIAAFASISLLALCGNATSREVVDRRKLSGS